MNVDHTQKKGRALGAAFSAKCIRQVGFRKQKKAAPLILCTSLQHADVWAFQSSQVIIRGLFSNNQRASDFKTRGMGGHSVESEGRADKESGTRSYEFEATCRGGGHFGKSVDGGVSKARLGRT